jgi:Carboxypeptidase regulatory-like domain/TonB dependent receptor
MVLEYAATFSGGSMADRKRQIRKICVVAGLLFLNISMAVMLAQSTAQISGAVKDQTGAVLPGVEVTMTQTDTGFKRNAVTDETGSYILPNLPIGPYRFEAALPGFRTYAQAGITLQVNSNPVINAVLQIGQVSDEVNVQADAALVETRSTGVGQVMDNVRVLELPLNGRRVADLILISGGAVQGTNTFTYGARGYNQTAISVAGGQGAGVEYTLDGGTHNDVYTGLGVTMPFPDALQEFKLETNALPAQYGHHSSAAVNAVTKSGTNQFHGSLFEFVRNNFFNANNAATQTRDTLKRNQFGGTFGGPIIQNKLFFFGGHQTTMERSSNSPTPQFVPTPAMLEGDFTAFASKACGNGVQRMLRAPVQNLGVNGNGDIIYSVNKSLLSPAALNLAGRLPAAQDACGQIRFNRAVVDNEYTSIVRIDYQLNDKHSLFGRYLDNYTHNLDDYDGVNVLTFSRSALQSRVHSFVLGDTYTIRPNMVSSFHATVNPITNEAYPPEYFDLSDLGVKNVYHYVPKFFLMTVTNGFSISGGNGIRSTYNSLTYQFAEDLSLIRGAHQIGLGGTFIRTHENSKLGLNRNPRPMFNGGITGQGLTDFLLGRMSSMLQAAPGIVYKRQKYFSLYVQDTWKATSRLTINAGLRWEPYQPPSHLRGYTTFFDRVAFDRGVHSTTYPTAPAGLQFPGDPGVPGFKYGNNRWNEWAPRLGLAWDPKGDGRMTVRAAYGIFYELPYAQKSGPVLVNAPYAGGLQLTTPPGGFDDPWSATPGGNPFPISLSNPLFPLRGTYPVYPKTVKNPYVHQWNFSLQKQIGSNWLVTGNYLGTSTIHLWASSDINPVIVTPDASRNNYDARRALYLQDQNQGQYFGVVARLDDGATANYNGLLLSVQHRRTNGLTVQGNYTWSHCIGDLEEAQLGIPAQYEYPGMRSYYRGNCNQDRRHNFSMSTVYETPHLGSSNALRALTGGWRVSGIVRILSGSYLTITSGIDTSLTNALGGDRANQILPNPYPEKRTIDQWINRAAFGQPLDGQFGNMGVNNIIGPGSIRIDMGLTRAFKVYENHSIEVRGEAFNLPNHVNPNNPTTVLNNSLFGKITTVGDPRILQFALKYAF